jgi:hypothetical protein
MSLHRSSVFTKVAVLRAAICLVSVFLLMLLGVLGDLLPNVLLRGIREMGNCMPAPTSFVIENYPLNHGCFLYSLTPWMIVFAGLVFQKRLFLYWFALAWLVALAYCCSYVFAWTVPYYLLTMAMGSDTIIKTVVTSIDWVLAAGFALLWLWRWRRKRCSKETLPPPQK